MPKIATLKFDTDIIERLSAADTAYDFFTVSYDLFEDAINIQLQNIFKKDTHTLKYAIEPLLNKNGPLANIDVRIKLLYSLGLLSRHTFQNIEIFIELNRFVKMESRTIDFLSPLIINRLKAITTMPTMPTNLNVNGVEDNSHYIVQMKLEQNKQVIKSSLILAITEIIKELHRETPLNP